MSLRRFSLFLRLPLAVLICSQLVYLSGNSPPDEFLASPEEVSVTLDELGDDKSFDVGLPIVIFETTLNQHSDWVLSDFGHVSQGAALERRATGPPPTPETVTARCPLSGAECGSGWGEA